VTEFHHRRLPAVFFGHGSPMNALQRNRYTLAWQDFGRNTPRPLGILCVSAHWYTQGTAVTAMQRPKTIHDFGGFPRELYEVSYPAPGDPALASRVRALLGTAVTEDVSVWGLDHGTWSVLMHAYPGADIPVVQLSIDGSQPLAYHYDLAKGLAPLRDEGILIVGSGNVVHNLQRAVWGKGALPFAWATRFDDFVRSRLLARDHATLADMRALGADGALCIPTPEHYLPLLYVISLQNPDDELVFVADGIELASISMMSIAVGRMTGASP
jgi:4,5-DOPA dioxygenase extradiol